MVTHIFHGALVPWLVAQQPAQPVLPRLDPLRRAAVLMAILALVLTGLMLVGAIMMGARWVRRMARQGPASRERTFSSSPRDGNQRLRESLPAGEPDVGTGSTIQIDRAAIETKIDGISDRNLDRPADE